MSDVKHNGSQKVLDSVKFLGFAENPSSGKDHFATTNNHNILHVWRKNTMIDQTNKIGNFVFA